MLMTQEYQLNRYLKVNIDHTTRCSWQSNANTDSKPPSSNSGNGYWDAHHEAKYEP
jgi:hypothetical protein